MKGHLTEKHRLTRKQTTLRPDNVWPDLWKHIYLMHENAKRSKSGLARNHSSIMPENYVVSSSLNLRMRTVNTLVEKLEIPMPAAMPCKTPANCRGETCRSIEKRKTKYACIVYVDETMRTRVEGVPHRYHEDHAAAKGINSLRHHNLVHKFFRCRNH